MASNNTNNGSNSNCVYKDLGLYFLELARLGPSMGLRNMEEEEEAPNELNTVNSSGGFLAIAPDKLSVKYSGHNLHGYDVGVAQGNKPVPTKRLLYYFEIYVKDAGAKGQIAIGFTNEGFSMRRQPGWEAHSFGYHGDDGMLYSGQGRGEHFGPTYTTGDIVGGGINFALQRFFFTKNGTMVGTVPKGKEMKAPLYPTISVHSQNEEVQVNFGQNEFAFGLKEYEADERLRQQTEIEGTDLKSNSYYGTVRHYLLHYGYGDTLNSLDMALENIKPPVDIAQFDSVTVQHLNPRKTVRQLIRNGQIDSVNDFLHDVYPQIVQDEKSATCCLLHCQKFIELIRDEKLQEAVGYATSDLVKYLGMAEYSDYVQECCALLAYENPLKSPVVGHFLSDSHRDVVADAVNAMILSKYNKKGDRESLHSTLERALRQLTVCSSEKRAVVDGGQGEVFHLHRVLNSG